MGCSECCFNLKESISKSRPAQLALAFAGGIIFMTLLFAVSGTFARPNCPTCSACFHFAFALNSQQTLCKAALLSANKTTVCDEHLLQNLSIHGLWPVISARRTGGDGGFSECTDKQEPPFTPTVLTDKDRQKMSLRWKNAFKEEGNVTVNDTTFWRHEWEKHGSCSPYSVKEYFERGLELDERYPVNAWLAESGIVPNNSKAYSIGDLTGALSKRTPLSTFYLQCLKVKSTLKGGADLLWLQQVVLCVEWADGRSLIACPQRPPLESCSEPFYFVEDYAKM